MARGEWHAQRRGRGERAAEGGRTLIMGAMQLVVQLAAVQMTCESLSLSSLTPTTTLRTDGSLTGADTTTRFTPHTSRYGRSFSTVRNLPVQSMTISTPSPFQSTLVKSLWSEKVTVLPSTLNAPSDVFSTSLDQMPCTESYLTRYAAVSAPPVISLTWTISRSGIMSHAKRNVSRPMRPNPLIAAFTIAARANAAAAGDCRETLNAPRGSSTPFRGMRRRRLRRLLVRSRYKSASSEPLHILNSN